MKKNLLCCSLAFKHLFDTDLLDGHGMTTVYKSLVTRTFNRRPKRGKILTFMTIFKITLKASSVDKKQNRHCKNILPQFNLFCRKHTIFIKIYEFMLQKVLVMLLLTSVGRGD